MQLQCRLWEAWDAGSPARCDALASTKRGQCGHMIDLELPRTTGTAYSPSCAWEKLWQETGPRPDKCSWQVVYSPRTMGWAASCSPSFANTVLPTTLSTASWTVCVTYCLFPWQCVPPFHLHSQLLSMNHSPCLSFLLPPPNPFSVAFYHTKLAPSALSDISLVKPCVSLHHELHPFPCFMTPSTCGW